MAIRRKVLSPRIKFVSSHLYTWVERGPVRDKCLAREHKLVTPTRARTQTAQPGVHASPGTYSEKNCKIARRHFNECVYLNYYFYFQSFLGLEDKDVAVG